MFGKLFSAALLALTAENLLFSGGMGVDRALRAARRPATAGMYSLFTAVFTLLAVVLGRLLAPLYGSSALILYPAAMTALTGAAYLGAAWLLRRFAADFYAGYARILAQSAANTVVVGAAFSQWTLQLSAPEAVGFALGTGAAFFIAVLALRQGLKICSGPHMPRAFCGLPALFLYIGILSLAFAGF